MSFIDRAAQARTTETTTTTTTITSTATTTTTVFFQGDRHREIQSVRSCNGQRPTIICQHGRVGATPIRPNELRLVFLSSLFEHSDHLRLVLIGVNTISWNERCKGQMANGINIPFIPSNRYESEIWSIYDRASTLLKGLFLRLSSTRTGTIVHEIS